MWLTFNNNPVSYFMLLDGSVLAPEKEAELKAESSAEDDGGEENFEGSVDEEVEEGGESDARLQINLNMT